MIVCSENLDLSYFPQFLEKSLADKWYSKLISKLEWDIEHYQMFGKILPSPRMMAWYADANLNYRYSGIDHIPLAWTDELLEIKSLIEAKVGRPFNAVLANLYRDGMDSMGWHADDENELGQNPVIASLSLGEQRNMNFRTKSQPRTSFRIMLTHGSLLVMQGLTQHCWQHAIPKTTKICSPRVNLTFRWIWR